MGCCSISKLPNSISTSLKKQSDELSNLSKSVISMEETIQTVKTQTKTKISKLTDFVDWQEEIINLLKQFTAKAKSLKEERTKLRTERPSESQISEDISYQTDESSSRTEIDLDDLNIIISGHQDKIKEYLDELRRESQQNTRDIPSSH